MNSHYYTEQSRDGHTIHHYLRGDYWKILRKCSNVLCEDGIRRTVVVPIRGADTFFTISGFTKAKGKTVSGFMSYDDDLEQFTFKATGKNAAVIDPNWNEV